MTHSPSLGRGLSALLEKNSYRETGQKERSGSGEVVHISPAQLTGGKFQPRDTFDVEKLKELASSIQKSGILQPIIVRPLKQSVYAYEIVAGERRWQAAKLVGRETVPVLIHQLNDEEALEIALIENIQRADLNALEEAVGYKRLIEEFSYTQETVAKSVGKSRSQIANTLRLLNLPKSIQDHIRKKNLTAGHARALLGAENPEKLSQEIIDQNLSVREAERRAANKDRNYQKDSSSRDPDLIYLEGELRRHLLTNVNLIEREEGVLLQIDFPSFDRLDNFIQKICE